MSLPLEAGHAFLSQVTKVMDTSGSHSCLILKTMPKSRVGGLCNSVPLRGLEIPNLGAETSEMAEEVGRRALEIVRSKYLRLLSAERDQAAQGVTGRAEPGQRWGEDRLQGAIGLSENGSTLCLLWLSRLTHILIHTGRLHWAHHFPCL